jgi:hypothetical protein
MGLGVRCFEIQFDPGHKVILEHTLDSLVKDIRGNDLVNICAGEFPSEGLRRRLRVRLMVGQSRILINSLVVQQSQRKLTFTSPTMLSQFILEDSDSLVMTTNIRGN